MSFADGPRYFLPRATPIYQQGGAISGATVILQDVTRLRRFDELKNDLVATVDRREGRKVFVSAEGTNPDGVLTFRGNALFITVDLSHFDLGATSGDDEKPVAL